MTLDGINIQDNFIRTNSLDFLPNRPTSDNVAEFSITTSVPGADSAGGASSVRMVTPSGTNTFRGSVFEFNRDSEVLGQLVLQQPTGVAKSELKRNQFGGRARRPDPEEQAVLLRQLRGVPPEDADLAEPDHSGERRTSSSGVFRYVGTDGTVRSVNVMQLSGLPVDPKLRSRLPVEDPGVVEASTTTTSATRRRRGSSTPPGTGSTRTT